MCALELADNLSILIVAKKNQDENSSFYAQGGMSVVLNGNTSSHISDTIKAADGLADKDMVEFLSNNSKVAFNKLENYGVQWTKLNGNYHFSAEGGHSKKRVAHVADHSGKSIHNSLFAQVIKHKNINIKTNYIAIDLLIKNNTCGGAYILHNSKISTIVAKKVVLATGGASKVYKYTTNPDTSTGDGIAMAYRSGCIISNMEFSQFHPTCLYHPYAKSFLISEALRGEGAKLLLPNGEEFMYKYSKNKELASRDIVARAIDFEIKKEGLECVYLDISFKNKDKIKQQFPTIYAKCLAFNIDITTDKIPVVPAAHYSCGGVKTDKYGRTNIANLYAIGEVAYTGVHGANRLASNSLLECVVFAISCAHFINFNINTVQHILDFPPWNESNVCISKEKVFINHLWDEVRLIMWNYVGIVRSNARLNYAKKKIKQTQLEVDSYYQNYFISNDLIELRNLVLCAQIIIDSAIMRDESRGLHYNTDYLKLNNNIKNTQISKL